MTSILTRDTFTAGLISQGTTTVPTPVNDTDAATKLYADSKGVSTGATMLFPPSTSFLPAGWLVCDGALISRTTYADLYAKIGTTYGAGDGSTTFALPKMRSMIASGSTFITRFHIIKY